MIVDFKSSFLKSVKKLNDKKLKESVLDCIREVESVGSIQGISNLKKLKGFKDYYRIRIGNYRIGLKIESNKVIFVAFQDRKDIYKNFP